MQHLRVTPCRIHKRKRSDRHGSGGKTDTDNSRWGGRCGVRSLRRKVILKRVHIYRDMKFVAHGVLIILIYNIALVTVFVCIYYIILNRRDAA